jgi:FtsP/CotA-like multicopper oxidase with cupredoxin domain
VKKANGSIVNNGNQAHSSSDDRTNHVERARLVPQTFRRNFTARAVGVAILIAVVIAVAVLIAPPLIVAPRAQAQNVTALSLTQNAGSPPFANPLEVRSRPTEKRLRMIMKIISGTFTIPNVGTETMRQYRGWDPALPAPDFGTNIAPGPTLRARLGDKVEISFLNEIDDSQFSYTFDTESKPGFSSFGCDQSGPKSTYPGADIFPNCFHGSSTANIHFHGTHTSPDGLGDNVLVQVLPQVKQPDWTATFDRIFNSGNIPQKWNDLPLNYRLKQMFMLMVHDKAAAAAARKNGLLPPESLVHKDMQMIKAGQWPQYIMGAFPNFFEIPDYASGKFKAGQAPGTHWYHAHKHGSTSLHILNGLAGAFVIESSHEGGYDHFIRKYYGWGDSYGEHEKIIVFQQFDPTQNLERGSGGGGKGIKQVLVNGEFTPTITMRPGEVQLWRLVNATEGNNAGIIGNNNDVFQTTGFAFRQTAQDGVQFSPSNYTTQPFLNTDPAKQVPGGLRLASGNRADLLVQAPLTPGVVAFQTTKDNVNNVTLFFVNVTGTPVTMDQPAFPTTWAEMPKFLDDLAAPPANTFPNPVQFQWEAGRAGPGPKPNPPHFMINDKQFEEMGTVVDQCMPLGGLQDWILENFTTVAAHPFHIHINPFQVISIDTPSQTDKSKPPVYTTYAPKDNFVWQDVIAIPPAVISKDGKLITPGRIRIRHTFVDFTGTYVLHCHILAHEDRGMMQLVRVVPVSQYPAGCQIGIPEHH